MRCADTVRGFSGGPPARCRQDAYAKVTADNGEHAAYCIDHLAANITGWVTEYRSVTAEALS